MALYKRGTVWWVEFAPEGRPKIRESTGTADKVLAQAYHDRRKHQVYNGDVKPTWDAAVDRWVQERSDKRSLSRDVEMAEWLTQYWHGKLLDAISDVDIRKAMELKRSTTSPSTANHYLAFTKSLFNKANLDWDWTDRTVKVRKYPSSAARIRFLTESELERLRAELPPHLKAMVDFSILTGLRQSNVTNLKWKTVDLKRRIVWVEASDYKTKRQHAVPLSDEAVAILEKQQGQHPEYVFTYKGQRQTSPCRSAWRKALERAGIKDFRWHDLRHTFASYHAMQGTPLLVLKQLGGWQNMSMVTRYAHLSDEATRKWVNNINVGGRLQSEGPCV